MKTKPCFCGGVRPTNMLACKECWAAMMKIEEGGPCYALYRLTPNRRKAGARAILLRTPRAILVQAAEATLATV